MDNYDNFVKNEVINQEEVLGTNKCIQMLNTTIDVLSYDVTI